MRPIDADALMKLVTVLEVTQLNSLLSDVKCIIRDAPTIEERKHGHWKVTDNTYRCPICQYWDVRQKVQVNGRYVFKKLPNYCPCCGAQMDEEVKADE